MSATAWPFIDVDEAGSPTIPTKGLKVLQLVREHLAYGWDAEQLRRQHPHLSLSEIHAALGYYHENRAECDEMLHRDDQRLEALKDQLVNPALQERLRRGRVAGAGASSRSPGVSPKAAPTPATQPEEVT